MATLTGLFLEKGTVGEKYIVFPDPKIILLGAICNAKELSFFFGQASKVAETALVLHQLQL